MMKRAIFGLAAVGAVIALGPALRRRMVQKMREHCQKMAAQCRAKKEVAGTREQPEREAPQFIARGEPVGTA